MLICKVGIKCCSKNDILTPTSVIYPYESLHFSIPPLITYGTKKNDRAY